jgi:hypothetical protein
MTERHPDPYRVVGYTYKGRDFNPGSLIEHLIREEGLPEGARFSPPEVVLDSMAKMHGVDRSDERALDLWSFPKPIHEDQVGAWDETWLNGPPVLYPVAAVPTKEGFGSEL